MSATSMDRRTFRVRGPHMLNFRVTGGVIAGLTALSLGNSYGAGTAVLGLILVSALWQGWAFRPEMAIEEDCIKLRFLLREKTISRTAVRRIELSDSSLLWYRTRELCVVLDDGSVLFPWISWFDDPSGMLLQPARERSQRRILTEIRESLADGSRER